MKDLAVLVADKNMESVMRSLLARHQALRIRAITADVFVHPRRDPGCANEAHQFLSAVAGEHRYALVMFDHQGSGREQISAAELAWQTTEKLELSGWRSRCRTIVLSPELEVWVWSSSPHVAVCLGWENRIPDLRSWLQGAGHWPASTPKPPDPKGAMEAQGFYKVSVRSRQSGLSLLGLR